MSTPKLRINRHLATLGLASRREIDRWIEQGRVKLNGKVLSELGVTIDPTLDQISVDGKRVSPITSQLQHLYLAFFKPRHVITTLHDPQGRPTLRDYIATLPRRVFPVGRLDYDADGLLLLTSDGDFCHKLLHPSFGHKRVYRVKVEGIPTPQTLGILNKPIVLDDGSAHFNHITPHTAATTRISSTASTHSWWDVEIGIGRYHIVKRLWAHVGHPVEKLRRIRYAAVELGDLKPGEYRSLTRQEIQQCQIS